jgi:FkbM family methyltransferase
MSNLLERLDAYIHNLGWRRGLGVVLYRQLDKLLNPGGNLVWGDLGEDALLLFYLTEVLSIRKPGFYVDVGCNHPINHSNTWLLYQRGWRGIVIDANHLILELYKKIRPRDQIVNELVSDIEQEMDFYVFEGSLVSTVELHYASAWEKSSNVKEVRSLSPKTLNAIMQEYQVPDNFELLKIDVEGHDAAVLRSIDLTRYQPIIILVEIHHESIETITHNEIYQRLATYGYRMVSLAGYNGIFIKQQAMS